MGLALECGTANPRAFSLTATYLPLFQYFSAAAAPIAKGCITYNVMRAVKAADTLEVCCGC